MAANSNRSVRERFFFGVLLAAILLIAMSYVVFVQANLTWKVSIVDDCSSYKKGTIAVDSNNNPHIAYEHVEKQPGETPTGLFIMYASWNGSGWASESIDEGNLWDFKMNREDKPYILYENKGVNTTLILASRSGSQWNKIEVANNSYGSLAIDSTGTPHIAYIERPYGRYNNYFERLRYAVLNGSIWDIQTINAPVKNIDHVELELDSGDRAHILLSYNEIDGSKSIKYGVLSDLGWEIKATKNGLLKHGNLVLDSSGFPHLTLVKVAPEGPAYWFNMTLEYAVWNGLNWNIQAVDYNITDIGYLALDKNDNPHVDYHIIGLPHGSLRYATLTDGQWMVSLVADSRAYASGPLVLDSSGVPHITYLGSENAEAERTVYCMYATPNGERQPIKTEAPTQPPTSTDNLLIVIPVAGVAVAVLISAFLWKGGRKRGHRKNQ